MEYFNETNNYDNYGYPTAIPNTNPYQYDAIDYSNTNPNYTYFNANFKKTSFPRNHLSQDERITENYFMQKQNQLDDALNMIRDAVMDELNDEIFYSALINQAIEEEDKNIIMSIRDDEMKHNRLLRDLYYALTGVTLPQAKQAEMLPTHSYFTNLKNALFSEIEATDKYRKILANMPDRKNINIIMEILVDEIAHANKYNYLIDKNRYNMSAKDTNEPND